MEAVKLSHQSLFNKSHIEMQSVLQKLNSLDAEQLIREAYNIFGNKLIATTSGGITSGALVHYLSELDLPLKVVFIDTGFLFQETLDYFKTLKTTYSNLTFVRVGPKLANADFLSQYGTLYESDPDLCCAMNKIQPLEDYINHNGIQAWISAVRKGQTDERNSFARATLTKKKIYKLHPFLDWTTDEIHTYMQKKKIPSHLLYIPGKDQSIGCVPCTKGVGVNGREDRWNEFEKTECGLHLNL